MSFRVERWTVANILPVAFMLTLIGVIWILYMCMHIVPLVTRSVLCDEAQIAVPGHVGCLDAAFSRGTVQAAIQQLLTIFVLICFGRAIFTDPGSVPEEDEWLPHYQPLKRGPEEIGGERDNAICGQKLSRAREVKHTGARRFCKWCNRFKPDRSHHCRICRSCILRMDHHCPWIANCVGFRNHKYFILLVFYSLLDCFFVIATSYESLRRSIVQETEFSNRFLIVFCVTLAAMMGALLLLFFGFHSWLMLKATTTIEFCEKTQRQLGGSQRDPASSMYDLGNLNNIRAVLGSNMLLWFLPTGAPLGDGLSFKVPEELDEESDNEATALLSKRKKMPELPPEVTTSTTASEAGAS